jgi:hypothetical protein
MKTVIIEVLPDGSMKLEGQGFKGAECEKATAALEKALGVTGKRTKKPEWYKDVQFNQRVG